MMYAGDEYYGDDVTSPLERPLPTYRRIVRQPVREQTKRVKRTARGEPIRDDRPLPMNGTDYHLDVPFSTVARRTPHEGSDGNT